MLDPKNLLDQMFSGNVAGRIGQAGQLAEDRLNRVSGAQGFAGGAAAGSLLGLLLGGKKMRKLASGALGYGGAAALGALAHRAYQNYTEGRSAQSAPMATPDEISVVQPEVMKLPSKKASSNGRPFELVLIEAMVAAAKADALASQVGLASELRAHLERQALGFNDQESVKPAALDSRVG